METPAPEAKEASIPGKPPRFRSVAYPSNTISHCTELTTRINKVFGSLTYTPREAISKQLEISDSHLQTQLSSCVQYGLLELKPGEGYKPTPLFTKIYKPLPTENPLDALIECFERPELYKMIIGVYDGDDLPMLAGLSTILYRNHKVSEQASTLAAKIFIENAKSLGVLKEDYSFKILRNSATVLAAGDFESAEEVAIETSPTKDIIYLPYPQQVKSEEKKNPSEVKIPVLLDDGGIAEIVLPNGIKKVDLERISKVINAYL